MEWDFQVFLCPSNCFGPLGPQAVDIAQWRASQSESTRPRGWTNQVGGYPFFFFNQGKEAPSCIQHNILTNKKVKPTKSILRWFQWNWGFLYVDGNLSTCWQLMTSTYKGMVLKQMPKFVDFQDFQVVFWWQAWWLIVQAMEALGSITSGFAPWFFVVEGMDRESFHTGRIDVIGKYTIHWVSRISFQYKLTQLRFELGWQKPKARTKCWTPDLFSKTERPSNSWDFCGWSFFWEISTNSWQMIRLFNPDIILKHLWSLSAQSWTIHHWDFSLGPGFGVAHNAFWSWEVFGLSSQKKTWTTMLNKRNQQYIVHRIHVWYIYTYLVPYVPLCSFLWLYKCIGEYTIQWCYGL